VLHFLFSKPEFKTPVWEEFASNPEPFLAKSHLKAFLGFANDQLRRLLNQRAKDVNRPFLEEKHGYDTKYAMHLIRLFGEAKEFMECGRITLPRPNSDELIAIRHGKYKLHQIEELAKQLEQEALAAQDHSPLPEKANRKEISGRVARAYLTHWEQRRA
jgi:hypothetical protein